MRAGRDWPVSSVCCMQNKKSYSRQGAHFAVETNSHVERLQRRFSDYRYESRITSCVWMKGWFLCFSWYWRGHLPSTYTWRFVDGEYQIYAGPRRIVCPYLLFHVTYHIHVWEISKQLMLASGIWTYSPCSTYMVHFPMTSWKSTLRFVTWWMTCNGRSRYIDLHN